MCPFHLHQPSGQPGAVRAQLPVVGQGGLPAGRYCLLPLFASSINILIHLLIPSKPTLGLESPTHALRADADPSAQSASATYITLAQEHPYDRHIEIILHLSGEKLGTFSIPHFRSSHVFNAILLSTEAHSPLVILERGRFSFSQYEEQISSRRDFIRCARKDSEPERKVGARPRFPHLVSQTTKPV